MDFPHSPNFAVAPPPPTLQMAQNSNTSAPARDNSSNLTSGTADPQAQNQCPRPLALSCPQHNPATSAPTFRAPAHKHAHHLHSIPPREKSTRTLIIDHLLWVHAVTRFAQARAELAMTDHSGGPGAPNYERRERPEQWHEHEEVASEGEHDDVDSRELRDQDRRKGPEMTSQLDLPYARRLRQRAESLEHIITSMLETPPRDVPSPEEGPMAPQPPPSVTPSPARNHGLPNGVRLRLALTTIINDLFARHAPVQRHWHLYSQGGMPTLSSSSASGNSSGVTCSRKTTQSSLSSSTALPVSLLRVPQSLAPLLSVSRTTTTTPCPLLPKPQEPLANNLLLCPRVRGIFAAGATYPITTGSTPSPRCPRHLHHSCEICLAPDRGADRTTCPWGASHTHSSAIMAQGGGITGFAEGVGVGSGLARSGTSGTLLRRERVSPPSPLPPSPTTLDDETYQTDDLWTRAQGSGDTILTGLIPRFVRLSALVALELGREVGAEEAGPGSGSGPNNNNSQKALALVGKALVPTVQWYLLLAGLLTCAVFEGYLTAEWRGLEPLQVLLGFGLGGAAVSHDAGEDDDGAVPRSHAIAVDEKYVEFEPDGMPDLSGAVDVLFPSRRANAGTGGGIGDKSGDGGGGGETKRGEYGDRVGSGRNDDAAKLGDGEAEYSREMGQRLARFLDIPAGTRDLTRHLEDLTWRYPMDQVERTALRFCEALEQWRGKPELETYRKQSPMPSHRIPVSPPGSLDGGGIGIGATANAAVRRAIGRYFIVPSRTTAAAAETTTATSIALADVLVSDVGEDDERVVIGRKRSHSAGSGPSVPAATTSSNRRVATASAGDRWRERRGYI